MEDYVLITGASSGLGRAIAVTLSKNYPLILGGRNVERLEETRSMCNDSDKHIFWNYDLSDVEGIHDNLKTFIKDNGLKIGGFVHSAGIVFLSNLTGAKLEDIRKVMDVNFFSAIETLKVLVTKRVNSKNLRNVIFISSIAAFGDVKGNAYYGASKVSLNLFAKAMADELAPNVRVNTINPAMVHTHMTKRFFSDVTFLEQYNRKQLLGFCEPQDIADMAEFLMSDKSRKITGQHFIVDGGVTVAL